MQKLSITAALAFCAATPVASTEHNEPTPFTYACNGNGAVMSMPAGETVYLGKSCDVFIPGKGEGRWWLAASGFLIDVPGYYRRINGDPPCNLGCLPNQ